MTDRWESAKEKYVILPSISKDISNYYLSGRNRYISKIIVQIHYQGDYSLEIKDLKISKCRTRK
jgi:hypothetical protein